MSNQETQSSKNTILSRLVYNPKKKRQFLKRAYKIIKALCRYITNHEIKINFQNTI